ncbi:MAG: hypothetical protein KKH68_10185 [Proteobacteria bacterium]|nr:hypothetical protein [Pseudomonadota bacterium]
MCDWHTFAFRNRCNTPLHAKIVLSFTAVLIASGTLLIMIMEWNNTLAPLSVHGRFLCAFFQSVTARTAGFNTLSIGSLSDQALFVLILLRYSVNFT